MTVRFAVLVMIRLAACLWVVSQRGCAMAQQPSVVPNSATPPFLLARFDDDVYGTIPPRHHTPGQNHLTPQQLPALGEDLGPEDELYIVPNHRQAAERSTVRLTPKNGATFRSAKPCIIIMTYVSGPSRNLSLFSSLSPPNMPLGDSMFQVEHFVAARGTRRSEKVNTFSVLVYWFWVVIMTSLRWIGVRQTDVSLVIEDRPTARVAAPPGVRARTVAWANRARIVQGRARASHRRYRWNRNRHT